MNKDTAIGPIGKARKLKACCTIGAEGVRSSIHCTNSDKPLNDSSDSDEGSIQDEVLLEDEAAFEDEVPLKQISTKPERTLENVWQSRAVKMPEIVIIVTFEVRRWNSHDSSARLLC